jgi:hypothetical protein
MTLQLVLHLLRNPHGHPEEELREARLAAADAIEAGERMSQAVTKRDLIALGVAADNFDATFTQEEA